jgi:RNase H-like domain found in reverse transcriptase
MRGLDAIVYMSKVLNEAERNYEVHDKEMLVIMRVLAEWRQYLQGARQSFEIWTDHKNLEYFMTARKLNHRQARWSLELADYDFTLWHCPGQLNKKANLLSRRKDHQRGVEGDNAGVTMLKQEFLRTFRVDIRGSTDELLDRIRRLKNIDGIVKEKVEKREKDWEEENGIIMWEGRVYIPKDKKL